MVEKKAELAALQAAKSPFAAAEAQAHPGELSTDEVSMASSRPRHCTAQSDLSSYTTFLDAQRT